MMESDRAYAIADELAHDDDADVRVEVILQGGSGSIRVVTGVLGEQNVVDALEAIVATARREGLEVWSMPIKVKLVEPSEPDPQDA